MKKQLMALLITVCAVFSVQSQTVQNYTSGHYSFTYPDGFQGIEAVAESFNLYWNVFNGVFRFNPDPALHVNRVVILQNKKNFDDYISSRIGETRNEFLFLKYKNPELSELVLFMSDAADPSSPSFSGPSLNRQLFLQFLYSFVSEPPIWIRDGFQAYFEKLTYEPKTKEMNFNPNSAWLEAAKNLKADPVRALNIEQLLSALTGSYESSQLYPQAWSFISFLMNTEIGEYRLYLCEACMNLEGTLNYNENTQQKNTDALKNRFYRFNSPEQCDIDFTAWLSFQYTFAELMQSGVTQYNEGKYALARLALTNAAHIRSDDPMLVYYLGLVSYAEKDYASADAWYHKALEYGADTSTVNWALGLSAYADKRWTEAKTYLEAAKTINPARYTDKAAKLLNSMPK